MFLLANTIQYAEEKNTTFLTNTLMFLMTGLGYPLIAKCKTFFLALKWIFFRMKNPESGEVQKEEVQTKEKVQSNGEVQTTKEDGVKQTEKVKNPESKEAKTIKERQEKWNRKE